MEIMSNQCGFIYLDITHPLVAWECYRGVLMPPSSSPVINHPSIMTAGMLQTGDNERLSNELLIESIRSQKFPKSVSRLKCIFVFNDEHVAKKPVIERWGGHFQSQNLAKVEVYENNRSVVDANWITYAEKDSNGLIKERYIENIIKYWKGEPYNDTPAWECLIDGKVIICGTELRKLAYEVVKQEMPKALEL